MTKTHQVDGKAYVNENTYQTGIMMNKTYQPRGGRDQPPGGGDDQDQLLGQ